MPATSRRLLITLISCLPLAACTVGPDYVRPDVTTPAQFKEQGQWQPAAAADVAATSEWWKAFADPALDALQERVVIDNQNLRLAEAQYRAALATLDSSTAGLYPTVGASAGRSRGVSSNNTPTANSNSLGLTANWEIDLWGGIRRDVESARAKADASADDLAAARLSTRALLAQTYVQLRAAEAQEELIARSLQANARFLELTRNREKAGVASSLDVAQAETQQASNATQLVEMQNQRAQLEHALAVLVGAAPADFSLPAGGQQLQLVAAPPMLPTRVLERRPDIAAAERRMAAANAQIGVSQAAYFPVLDLSGSVGYKSSTVANLLSVPNRIWSLGPTLAMTLFDGGARAAALGQANAQYDQAVASYRQTVLTSFQEVEDALSSVRLLEQEAASQDAAVAAATRTRVIAENQYQAGIANALSVITAQTAELSAQSSAAAIHSRRLQAIITLMKNAGGALTPP